MSLGKACFRFICWFCSCVLFLFSSSSFAHDDSSSAMGHARIAATEYVISVDGVLDDIAWENALVIELRFETSPGENVAPPVKTEALLIHNDGYLYVAFKAYDPDPRAIRAHLSDRDEIFGDDSVSILLDTFNDELRAFEFECNPLGIQRDALRNDAGGGHGGGDESWDVIWDSAGRLTEWGYVVEIAIPFNSLNFPRTNGEQTWGVILSRDYPRNVRHNIRNVPEDRSRNCSICQAAKISGFENISPGRNMEFTPTVTGYRYDEREDFPDGERMNLASESELGLTARWGITPNINLNVALNPDFSQVEADSYQLEINRQFALRFEEKRPFFLEGRDFFGTPINAVYTRSIVDPGVGLKVTGKEGANALGLFMARDQVTPLIFPGSQDSDSATLELESTASVLRYRRDILDSSTIGLLFTDREGSGYYNRVYGVDGRIRLTSTDTVSFQVVGSSTRYNKTLFEQLMAEEDEEDDDEGDEDDEPLDLPADTIDDWSHQFHYEHRTRDWNASVSHQRLGHDFRADIGHISRVGFQRFTAGGGRTWYGDSSDLITRLSVDTSYRQIDELNGGLLERELETGLRIRGAMQSSLSYEFRVSQQNFEDLEADLFSHSIRSFVRPAGDFDFEFNVSFGDAIDYRHAREGSRISLRPETSLNLGKHFRMDFEHEYTDFTVQDERLYLANISQARLIYQFNSRMFLRSILQFIDIRRNQAMYEDEIEPVSRRLFTQILFSYKLNPRTVLFLGYSDNYRAYQDIEFTQSDRTFFMKIGYAWVL